MLEPLADLTDDLSLDFLVTGAIEGIDDFHVDGPIDCEQNVGGCFFHQACPSLPFVH